MKAFKEIMCGICYYFGCSGFGWGSLELFTGDYQCAAWVLFVVSILFVVSFFAERLSE